MKRYYFPILIFLYFFSRIIAAISFPIFTDETLYARWVQEIQNGYFMRPLENGRQPLFLWIASLIDIIIQSEFLSLRITSIFSGFLALLGIKKLTKTLFKNDSISQIAILIYIINPFAFIHDSFGLLDSMVSAIVVWSLVFSISLVKNLRLSSAFLVGITLGIGLIVKSNVLLSVLLIPLTLLIRSEYFFKKDKFILGKQGLKWIFLVILSIIIAKSFELILLFHPNYFRILAANGIFVYPVREWVFLPILIKLNIFLENFFLLFWFLVQYFSTLTILVLFLPININKYTKEKLLLFLHFAVPFVILCLFGRVLFSRYILPMTIFLIPLFSFITYTVFSEIKSKYMKIFFLLTIFAIPIYSSLMLVFDYRKSFIPEDDKRQYFVSSEVFVWLNDNLLKIKKQNLGNTIYFLNTTDSLAYNSLIELNFYKDNNIQLITTKPSVEILSKSSKGYILTNRKIENPNVGLFSLFDKVDEPIFIYVTK